MPVVNNNEIVFNDPVDVQPVKATDALKRPCHFAAVVIIVYDHITAQDHPLARRSAVHRKRLEPVIMIIIHLVAVLYRVIFKKQVIGITAHAVSAKVLHQVVTHNRTIAADGYAEVDVTASVAHNPNIITGR